MHRKATALGDRDWQLGDLPPEHATADLDEQRITQALLQLCDNAVKHTAPADRIALSCSLDHGTAQLEVEDSGQGVPVVDRQRIFERFGRSRVPQGDDGFGLGLSIVKAIAEAHLGSVRVEDSPSGGARFVIRLPADRSA